MEQPDAAIAPAWAAEAGADSGGDGGRVLADDIPSSAEASEIGSEGQVAQREDEAVQCGFSGTGDIKTDSSHRNDWRARDLQAANETAASTHSWCGSAGAGAGAVGGRHREGLWQDAFIARAGVGAEGQHGRVGAALRLRPGSVKSPGCQPARSVETVGLCAHLGAIAGPWPRWA